MGAFLLFSHSSIKATNAMNSTNGVNKEKNTTSKKSPNVAAPSVLDFKLLLVIIKENTYEIMYNIISSIIMINRFKNLRTTPSGGLRH